MDETEKRIISWGMEEKCLVIHSNGTIVDVGKYTHLAVPPRRGIYLYPEALPGYSEPIMALRKSSIIEKRYCQRCPFEANCLPETVTVKHEKLWHPAIRPQRQRK